GENLRKQRPRQSSTMLVEKSRLARGEGDAATLDKVSDLLGLGRRQCDGVGQHQDPIIAAPQFAAPDIYTGQEPMLQSPMLDQAGEIARRGSNRIIPIFGARVALGPILARGFAI